MAILETTPLTTSTWTIPADSTVISSATITGALSLSDELENKIEKKIKEYTSHTDKHVDELEEDLDFLNEHREKHHELIESLNFKISELEGQIAANNTKIYDLEKERGEQKRTIDNLNGMLHWLESMVQDMQIELKEFKKQVNEDANNVYSS